MTEANFFMRDNKIKKKKKSDESRHLVPNTTAKKNIEKNLHT